MGEYIVTAHLKREIEKLKQEILSLAAIVEENVSRAVKSLNERDRLLAKSVINTDLEIDQMEIEIEEECLKIIALNQPVANDLRFIIAVLKINNDLERVGDLAVNIAERAVFLAGQEKIDIPFDFPGMAEKTQLMLKRSLDAIVNRDVGLAHKVRASDDEVDAINRQIYDQVQEEIRKHPDKIELLIHLLSASRHLERIADLATNIAEDVIYMVEGVIIRHKEEEYN